MIVINKLKFSNMFSYGADNEITFTDNRVTQLVGNNGVGKSSIPTILEETLYNKNSRGIKKAEIKNRNIDCSEYSSILYFSVGADEYILEKVVKSTAKVKLTKNGEDISGHTATQTYKLIEEKILKLDFNTFSKLVYQSMTSSLDFLKSTDTNRKKFLIGLLGLERYVDAEQAVKEASKQINDKLNGVKASVSTIQAWIKKNPQPMVDKEEVEVPVLDVSLEEQLVELSARQKVAVSNNQQVDKYNIAVKALEEHKKKEPAPTDDNSEELQKVTCEHTELANKKRVAEAEVQKLSRVKDTCPTCGQSIDVGDTKILLEKAKVDVAAVEELIKPLEGRLNEEKVKQTLYNARSVWEREYQHKTQILDGVSCNVQEKEDVSALKQKIQDLQEQINSSKRQISEASAHNEQVRIHNSKVATHNETLASYNQELSTKQTELDSLVDLAADLEVLVKALGTKGLIQYKIESMVKVFEDLINEYLSILSEGQFALSFEIDESKLVLNLYDHSNSIGINSPSSGEFNRINTATLLAVRKMMSSVSKVNVNLLFLDEVISVLDVQGKQTLIDLLLEEHSINSMIVSHGFEHPLATTITVIKEENVSCLS